MSGIFTFEEAAAVPPGERVALLGGKAAGLVGMLEAGFPVPPGFTLTTRVGLAFLDSGALSPQLEEGVRERIARLERAAGRRFGGDSDRLLVSVRSGAATSMPGMMDTLLNVGASADPYAELFQAIGAVFSSWRSDRAVTYRRLHGLGEQGSTAVTVQLMVRGDLAGPRLSGTGVLFTRDPSTGAREPVGEFIEGGLGSDLVDGTRTPDPLAVLEARAPGLHAELLGYGDRLEHALADMCDIEFTIEDGVLWLLQVRPGKRTDQAAARIAVELAEEGLISRAEAVRRAAERSGTVSVAEAGPSTVLCEGIAASPGLGSGHAVFDPDTAQDYADEGRPVVLVRDFTEPSDIHGMAVAEAVLTRTGGKMSHAAVVAREFGVACVCGAAGLRIDEAAGEAWAGGHRIVLGDLITVDGTSGRVHAGSVAARTDGPTEYQERLAAWSAEAT
ncbi:PEP/pyruvate-binding domain-containing protein [Actinocorallia sp. B10E7]|uniref:PEP/pyruvate-binding domain-containing protein n=1 Tax=Actinocorallia sp. B10E7 TaxID=3153558 RepID=UPI00325F9C93